MEVIVFDLMQAINNRLPVFSMRNDEAITKDIHNTKWFFIESGIGFYQKYLSF